MGDHTFSRSAFSRVRDQATKGGKTGATSGAEERIKQGKGMDPLVDPKGLSHLGPIRRSLPRFEKQGDLWVLTRGLPMSEETLLDTTGSMGGNVDLAFEALPKSYEMLTSGGNPILGRYDPQIATAIFNDVEDKVRDGIPVLCRTQFEMDEKIAMQMTNLVPGRGGYGNGKEDPQFGLFGAAYLTAASINRWGLKYYHFTVSDEPVVEIIDLGWLKEIFGDDVLERIKENGHDFDAKNLPDTAKTVMDLQTRAHAFFLQVRSRPDVTNQWRDLYGADHFIMLPDSTEYLHCVKAVIIGLTEGVLDLQSAKDFLREHGVSTEDAKRIIRAVAHIPLGAQALFPNFNKLPKAGDLFREKTDLWPINPDEVTLGSTSEASGEADSQLEGGPTWL
ncbi:MAG: hypothetical protein A3J76_01815 [Candidatus Moranbacteria bacterium RBG_13_45_13]|nr:MAG: hypothetical protein A3J76_01815 [Candidatus Moranbacteria bacterium RBG_13_45_13]